jgi:hypothetical protein
MRNRILILSALLLTPFITANFAAGASLIWDTDSATSGAQDGYGGTWDTVNSYWWNTAGAGSNALWSNTAPDSATFGVGSPASNSYNVTLESNITAVSITFANQNYIISPPTANLYALTVNGGINCNASASFTDVKITLGASQTWTVAAGQALTTLNSMGTSPAEVL